MQLNSYQALKPDELFSKLNQLQSLSPEIQKNLKLKYNFFRGYGWQLAGICLGLIEQSLIIGNRGYISVFENLRKKMKMPVGTRSQTKQEWFYQSIKEVFLSDTITKLVDKLKDENFLEGCEQFVKDLLKLSTKFSQFSLHGQTKISESINYISPPILLYLAEQFQSDIILIQYDKTCKEFSYQQFKSPSQKQSNGVIYSLPNGLYFGLMSQMQLNFSNSQIGDGFVPNLKLKQKQLTQNQSRPNISASSIKRDVNSGGQARQQDMVICDKCKSAFEKVKVYQNDYCRHSFCFQCLREHQSQYCLEMNCTKSLDKLSVKQFMDSYPKLLMSLKNKDQQNREQQSPKDLSGSSQQQVGRYKCSRCLKEFNDDNYFQGNQCSHKYCLNCIHSKVTEVKNRNVTTIKCDQCLYAFNVSTLNSFIEKKLQAQQEENNKCARCEKQLISNDHYKSNKCTHKYCYKCIYDKFQFSQQRKLSLKCEICSTSLDTDNIYKYLSLIQNADSPTKPSNQSQNSMSQSQKVKDQMSQSVSYSEKEQQQMQQQNQQIRCTKCYKQNPSSITYFVEPCKHGICIKCLQDFQRSYSYQQNSNQPIQCYGGSCRSTFTLNQVCSFIIGQDSSSNSNSSNNNKSQNSIPDNLSTSIIIKNNDNKSEKSTNSTSASSQNSMSSSILDIPKCQFCRNKLTKDELFVIKGCNHKFCISCLQKTNVQAPRCLASGCRQQIDMDEYEEFHLNQQIQQITESQRLLEPNQTSFKVCCSKCKEKDEIQSNSKPDYFKCKKCSKVHENQVPSCKCYCDKCGNQCKISGNTVMCVKCNYSYCQNCQQTEEGNQLCKCKCEYCGTQLKRAKQLCKCLENVCSICLNQYENICLNGSDDTLMRKNQDCIHSFCNACYYKKVVMEQNHSQKSEVKGSYKPLLVCLFC